MGEVAERGEAVDWDGSELSDLLTLPRVLPN